MSLLLAAALAVSGAWAYDPGPSEAASRRFRAPESRQQAGSAIDYAPARSRLVLPKGFHRVEPKKNHDVAYQFAFQSDKGPYEVRYHFNALTNRGKSAPGEVRADLDAPSPVYGQTVQMNMSETDVPFTPYPPDAVKKEFGADWGYLSQPFALDSRHDFNGKYKTGIVSLLHKNGVGSWVVIFLSGDPKFGRWNDKEVFYSVYFK